MSAQAQLQGRYLGGRPPYGYQLADAGPHPNPGKAAVGQRLHRLEPDPVAAPVVERIFAEYLGGRGLFAIAEGLTYDRIPSPSAHDPARNRHRDGRAWAKSAVKAILQNPRYTGRQVWNRQRRDEVLIDVEDVAEGHQTKMRWNDPSAWVWSSDVTHEPLVTAEEFAAVQEQMAASAHRPTARKVRASRRPFVLSGLVYCDFCGRRMQGNASHEILRYRCPYPSQYALANKVEHPRTVYVKEDAIVPHIDAWIATLFDEANLDATCEALAWLARQMTKLRPGPKPHGARLRTATSVWPSTAGSSTPTATRQWWPGGWPRSTASDLGPSKSWAKPSPRSR